MKIEKISDIYEVLKGYTRKKRLVVAFANDSHSIEAVYMAVKAGLGLKDIFLLKSVYSIVLVSLDIPTGYLADAWGRKNCLITGCIVAFGGYICYSLSSTFYAFFIAEILLGIGQSLVSG